VTASGVFCRATDACAGPPILRSLTCNVPLGPLPVIPPCQDPDPRRPVKGNVASRAQDTFGWLDARPCDRVRMERVPFDVPASYLAPFCPVRSRSAPSKSLEAPSRAELTLSWFTSRLPSIGASKMLLANFCNRLTTRAPVDRSISERADFRRADPPRASFLRCQRHEGSVGAATAPDHLAAIRPRLSRV
jgi:hypothetical protein